MRSQLSGSCRATPQPLGHSTRAFPQPRFVALPRGRGNARLKRPCPAAGIIPAAAAKQHPRIPRRECAPRRSPLLLFAVALTSLLPAGPTWALRVPAETGALRVQIHTLWNQDYLCFAAKVGDIMVTGSNTGPMSAPQQDDAIEFDLEAPAAAGPEAHRLIVSAAGGMTVLTRDAQGRWRTDSSWATGAQTVKYAVSGEGTLNDPADKDVGFTVECAIPWRFLGGKPPVGQEIPFNVICWMQGESEGMVSWAETAQSEQQIGDATRWGRMLITQSSALATAQGNWIQCPFVGRTPFIDGRLSAEEWLTASTLSFNKPEPTLVPTPIPTKQTDVIGTLLAVYRYDWQGDGSRPGAHFWQDRGGPATSDQPREGAGPWYSYERVAWHRAQLNDIQRAGIDIILAEYRGDDESRRTWARTGLDRLTEALKGMRAEGRSYPLVGMMLDTAPLQAVDLKSDDGKRRLYAMIREFFLHVPREFWAEVGARPTEGTTGGVPVLLGEPNGLADWDGGFLAFSQERFGRDFAGAKLIWLGSAQWRTRGTDGFYAYVRLPGAVGLTQEGAGGVSAVAVSPGFCPPAGAGGEIRPRREGRAYRMDWQRVLASAPELVILNSWNDFSCANELAPSRQYGVAYVDLTRYFSARLGSRQPHYLRLKKQAVPELLRPGTDYQVEFLAENVGTTDLQTGRRITADYRIVRRSDGKTVQAKIGAQDLSIMAGQTLRLPLVISTKDDHGDPLPPGEYLFSLAVMRSSVAYLRSHWFARPVAELTVPITVGEPPARRVTIVSTSLPSAIEAGAAEQVVVRLRNDGTATWRAKSTALSYHWVRHDDGPGSGDQQTGEQLLAHGARGLLPRDVAPGEVASVMIPVSAVQGDGSALPVPQPADLWHYRVQWDLVEGAGGWFSSQGQPAASEAIEVTARDRGVIFESAATPGEMEAGKQVKVAVVVGNAGPRAWQAANSYLTYHWHRWDGRDLACDATRTALAADAAPGQKVKLSAMVSAPPAPGPYWLVWDMVTNGESAATSGGARRADILVAPVMVRGGSFRTIDLAKATNVVAVTDDAHRGRGDFDGQGRSLPAEWVPPDQTGAADRIYPSGYYAPSTPLAEVPFAFPDASSGVAGAVACNGQQIVLGSKPVKRVHLLLASSEQQDQITLGLRLADGQAEQVTLAAPGWTELPPDYPRDVGAYTPYLRALGGDDPSHSASLYHRTLAPASAGAIALDLPVHPSVKILAITVEE